MKKIRLEFVVCAVVGLIIGSAYVVAEDCTGTTLSCPSTTCYALANECKQCRGFGDAYKSGGDETVLGSGYCGKEVFGALPPNRNCASSCQLIVDTECGGGKPSWDCGDDEV